MNARQHHVVAGFLSCWNSLSFLWLRVSPSKRSFRGDNNYHKSGLMPRLVILFLLTNVALLVHFAEACEISQYFCDNRRCISLDKFCNGVNDCGDGSDEPRYCSPCNRTYYGELGSTFTVAVHRPSSRDAQLPFVCQLTFAAGGSKFGDLVQLIFNSVTLGPSSTSDQYPGQGGEGDGKNPRCNEGHVTLSEPDRPAVGGHWCGHGWGQAVFFSETSRVTLTLTLLNVPVNPGTFAFDFRLSYKFLRKIDSVVRYGPPSRPYYRGQLLPGTFCSLIFDACDKLRCALQTPNFPGLYPRNVTCYYAIRQLNAPVGHRAVVQLGQEKDHLIFIRNRAANRKAAWGSNDPSGMSMSSGSDSSVGGSRAAVSDLSVGEECDSSSDHVTIYDGYTIRDPVLLRFCGGGRLPTITSSANELLMEFYSAPTDYLLQYAAPTPIQGFHVDVEIKYLAIGSHSYVENHNCHFTISSFQQKRGFLTSPQHSLPFRTTCTYFLEGSPGEIVWISLLKFFIGGHHGKGAEESSGYQSVAGGAPGSSGGGSTGSSGYSSSSGSPGNKIPGSPDCNNTYLQIWQGTLGDKYNNATLLTHLCEDTPIKKSCEFMLSTSAKSSQRACHPEESYISTGPHMSLKLSVEQSTVLRPVEFKLYYEFVDTRQDGDQLVLPQLSVPSRVNLPVIRNEKQEKKLLIAETRPSSCSRIFRSLNKAVQAGSFTSPRNVFFFGRGGVKNLTCVYRFQGGSNERVKITINKILLEGGSCRSESESNTGRSICRSGVSGGSGGRAGSGGMTNDTIMTEGQVQLWEIPWNDSRILRECFCELPSGPFTLISTSPALDLVLDITGMQAFHDQNHFTFEGRYEFVKQPDCGRPQRLRAPSGQFTMKIPEKSPYSSCEHFPWQIDPTSPSHYVFLTIPGRTIKKFDSKSWKSKGQQAQSVTSAGGQCTSTRNRILVYSGGHKSKLLQIICPEDTSAATSRVEIFSEGWHNEQFPNFVENPDLSMLNLPVTNQLLLELVSRGTGSAGEYEVKWLQISRKDQPLPLHYNLGITMGGGPGSSGTGGVDADGKSTDDSSSPDSQSGSSSSSVVSSSSMSDELEEDACFKFKCPELDACISPTLFCDGIPHCPSGHDEADCEYFPIPKTYLIIAGASVGVILVLSCCFACVICKKRREAREKLLMNSRTPTEEMFFGTGSSSHREIVC